ncbi:calcium-responsive transactivator isoform X4 [Equus asinus]|uniref:calcium-responsive transactivator isoform X4 n=1 Tax=Equus asinus TaxID=9793 RepID=UPI0038F7F8F7
MSVAFASARPRGKGEVTQQTIQKMLDENHHLIQCILDHQSKGKTAECAQYQQILHRNLVYLATIADSNQNMQSLLPAPPTQNMNLGPGALSQSGSSQGLHSQGSLSDAIGTGLPASSLLQGQIGNGPNHVSMQQTAQSTLPTTSMSMSGSGHGTGPGYSHSGPASQSVPLQGQGAIGNYVSRANINMQSNPGHGDYAYQQSSYTEQSYDRSFEESTQHYYESGKKQVLRAAPSAPLALDSRCCPRAPVPAGETPSTASSRRGTSRARRSSRPTPSSSTPASRATLGSSKDTGLPREPPPSTPATSKDRASSMEATERLRRARPPSSSGLTAMSRASMEITSSKGQAFFLEPCGGLSIQGWMGRWQFS